MSPKTIDLIYFNAGGGHRASALALEAVLRRQAPSWQVRLVNLFEVLDPQDTFRAVTGSGPEDWYNKRLARGWTLGMTQELKLLQAAIRLGHPLLIRQLQQHWLRTEPDLVVSLVPNFNRALYQSVASTLPGVPYITLLTDLADQRHTHAAYGTGKFQAGVERGQGTFLGGSVMHRAGHAVSGTLGRTSVAMGRL